MNIYIDGDSCPSLLRSYINTYTNENNITTYFVANHIINHNCEHFTNIICNIKKDAADDYIVQNTQGCDLVITRDILLAERLINKDICTINDRGFIFTKNNIKARLEDRALDFQLANLGFGAKKESTYSQKELNKFIKTFEKVALNLRRNIP